MNQTCSAWLPASSNRSHLQSISLAPEHFQGSGDDLVRLEAELALQLLERRRRAEGLHADDPAVVTHITLPPQRRRLFDGQPRLDGSRQHLFAIGLRLVLEDVPRWHRVHT